MSFIIRISFLEGHIYKRDTPFIQEPAFNQPSMVECFLVNSVLSGGNILIGSVREKISKSWNKYSKNYIACETCENSRPPRMSFDPK